jgi:hypothetical protein
LIAATSRAAGSRGWPAEVASVAGVDVADAGDRALIEEDDLQRRTFSRAGARERRRVEGRIQRLRPHRPQRAIFDERSRRQ